LVNQYANATNFYRDEVGPYVNTPNLAKIASGENQNPSGATIKGIFSNPDDDELKVLSDLPDNAKNQIVYSAIGGTNNLSTPGVMDKALTGLDNSGLLPYKSPAISDLHSQLQSAINKNSFPLQLLGAALGTVVGSHVPLPFGAGEGGGALGGWRLATHLAPYIRSNIPAPLSNAASSFGSIAYPNITRSIIGTTLGGNNGNR
jgi:hypothetical protein